MDKENGVLSVKKAFNILDILLCEDKNMEGIALSALSKMTGIKTNTLHNLLKTMIGCGYVCQNENSKYLIGQRCLEIGNNNSVMRGEIFETINFNMNEFCRNTKEAAVFYSVINNKKTLINSVQYNSLVKIDIANVEKFNYYTLPTSRVLLAYSSSKYLKRIINSMGLPNEKWDNIDTISGLETALEDIKARGYSTESKESTVDFAVPIFRGDTFLGALGCYAPRFRCDNQRSQLLIKELIKASESIKEELECRTEF